LADPHALQGIWPNPGPLGDVYTPQQTYEFQCLDQAEEFISRIRVQVRSWSLYSEWLKKGSGDPEATGVEPAPYNQYPNDDRADWKDFGDGFPTAFPGSSL
jgi:hypothetical protein